MTHQACNCLSDFNERLKEHNTEIDITFSIPRDGSPMRSFPKLATSKIETPFDLMGGSDVTKREWIGNMVPGAAAAGMAETIGETLILADLGESFFLSTREIWAKPGALALAIDNDQAAFRMDGGEA